MGNTYTLHQVAGEACAAARHFLTAVNDLHDQAIRVGEEWGGTQYAALAAKLQSTRPHLKAILDDVDDIAQSVWSARARVEELGPLASDTKAIQNGLRDATGFFTAADSVSELVFTRLAHVRQVGEEVFNGNLPARQSYVGTVDEANLRGRQLMFCSSRVLDALAVDTSKVQGVLNPV